MGELTIMEIRTISDDEERAIHGIQALMHANLSTAINNANEKLNGCRMELVVPIALSRLVYRELLILSDYHGFPVEKWKEMFSALLNDLVVNKVDMFKLKINPQKGN
jgi:hypothetical protein